MYPSGTMRRFCRRLCVTVSNSYPTHRVQTYISNKAGLHTTIYWSHRQCNSLPTTATGTADAELPTLVALLNCAKNSWWTGITVATLHFKYARANRIAHLNALINYPTIRTGWKAFAGRALKASHLPGPKCDRLLSWHVWKKISGRYYLSLFTPGWKTSARVYWGFNLHEDYCTRTSFGWYKISFSN